MPALTLTTGSTGAAIGTATVAAPSTLTIVGHALVNGQTVITSSPTGGASVLVPDAPYYVAAVSGNNFQLRPAPGAPPMVFGSGGTVVVDAAEAVLDAQGWRQAASGLYYKGRPASPDVGRFGARWGILRNASTPEVSVSGLTVTVLDMQLIVSTAGSTTRGSYQVAIPQGSHNLATADPAQTRIDLLIAEVLDKAADTSGEVVPGRTRIVQGTPGSGAPAIPSGTLLVATYTLTAGAASATEALANIFTVAIGGILPVANAAAQPAAYRREGDYIDVLDEDTLKRWSGSTYQAIAAIGSVQMFDTPDVGYPNANTNATTSEVVSMRTTVPSAAYDRRLLVHSSQMFHYSQVEGFDVRLYVNAIRIDINRRYYNPAGVFRSEKLDGQYTLPASTAGVVEVRHVRTGGTGVVTPSAGGSSWYQQITALRVF
jgi:hypothetical protein